MLIKCIECELQVSDKAISCPHCGYPLQPDKLISTPNKRRKNKRKRLPNGFGQICRISGANLRKPYRAMVTVGKDSFGKPICKLLKPQAFFETYNEAYEALMEYNKNPYDLNNDITVSELYEKWSDEYFKSLTSVSAMRSVTSAWAYCSSIYNMRAKDVRPRHLKACMEDGYRIEYRGVNKGKKIYATASTKSRMKSVFNLMFDYAIEYELITLNYARAFTLSDDIIKEKEENKQDHIIFTNEELDCLWENVNKIKYVDWILIQAYMGWRPQELATLRLDEVHLDEWYMQAGMKTEAGKQRIVPIHTKIRSLVQKNYDYAVSIGSEYLFNDKGQTHSGSMRVTYDKYRTRFHKVIEALELNSDHRPHDPRMTFVTRAKKSGMDEYAIKAIVGHRIHDITESTYTVRDLEWLRKDIEKIK